MASEAEAAAQQKALQAEEKRAPQPLIQRCRNGTVWWSWKHICLFAYREQVKVMESIYNGIIMVYIILCNLFQLESEASRSLKLV